MKIKLSEHWVGAAVGAALAMALGAGFHMFTFGSGLVNLSYDLLIVARPQIRADETVVVALDEKAHEELGQPLNAPWDRALHAQLIERLTAAEAKAIAFDIVFSDPNPAKPVADQQLADAIKKHGRVVLAADNVPVGPKTKVVIPPFDLLRESAAAIGSAEVRPGRDMIVREHPPGPPEESLPSLSWAAAEVAKAGVLLDRPGVRRWMNYYGPANSRLTVRYDQALKPELAGDELFRGRTVFVGARMLTKFAGERKDEYRTPFSFWSSKDLFMAGVEIQATAFLNLLRGDWLVRLPVGIERLIIILFGALVGYGLALTRPWVATGLAFAAAGSAAAGCYGLFVLKLTWFPWLILVAQTVLALFSSVVFNSIQLYVQKRLYEQTLSLYLSPKLVKKFAQSDKFLKPGAEKHLLTIVFTDIANFTSISEGLDSDDLAKLMNEYFHRAVSECIHPTDGTVVKYIGDAIFAFWNAPDQQPDHAWRACQAALRFREQPEHAINGYRLITRIGLHTGVANVGNFGSTERVDYTALGENINLASRMEGLNKYLGTDVLMSGDTQRAIQNQALTRLLGRFRLKGFEKSVEVHELVGRLEQSETSRPWGECFGEALRQYQQKNFAAARLSFERTLELRPKDGPSLFYLAHLAKLSSAPLPENWTPDIELTEK